MQFDNFLEERRFGMHDIFDCLTGYGVRKESYEIARMSRSQRGADFAVALEAANARPVPRARVEHDERTKTARVVCFGRIAIGLQIVRRNDAHEAVADRTRQGAAIQDQLGSEIQHIGCALMQVRLVLVAALAHHVGEQHIALPRVDCVLSARVWQRRSRRKCVGQSRSRILLRIGCQVQVMHAELTSQRVRAGARRLVAEFAERLRFTYDTPCHNDEQVNMRRNSAILKDSGALMLLASCNEADNEPGTRRASNAPRDGSLHIKRGR